MSSYRFRCTWEKATELARNLQRARKLFVYQEVPPKVDEAVVWGLFEDNRGKKRIADGVLRGFKVTNVGRQWVDVETPKGPCRLKPIGKSHYECILRSCSNAVELSPIRLRKTS